MYRGGRGNQTARRFARAWARVFGWGVLPKRWVTLQVPGRRSGHLASFPVGLAYWQGDQYLVSMLGEHCNWVRNVRAANGFAVLRRRRAVPVRLLDVPVGQRAPILKCYLQQVPGARPHIPVDRHQPVADFGVIAAEFPAFRVVDCLPPDVPFTAPS
jgi:hypothetical protein